MGNKFSIKKIIIIALTLFILSFVVVEGMIFDTINKSTNINEVKNLKYIIVLGALLQDNEVGDILKKRLDEAIKFYNLNSNVKIIVSGGINHGNSISESSAMYDYLVESGVDSKSIIKESKAKNTVENIVNSKEILKRNKEEDKKVLIVTSDFHMFRAKLISKILGLDIEGLASKTQNSILKFMIREYPSVLLSIVKSYIYK